MKVSVELLIVGAGPFGLSVAAMAGEQGIDYLVVGEPMGFWRSHMPEGMLLRSGSDWHLDPFDEFTMERYLREQRVATCDVLPLTREVYLAYVQWFQEQRRLEPEAILVDRLDVDRGNPRPFFATLVDGRTVTAGSVVLALGMGYFAHVPPDLAALVPEDRAMHTCDAVDFAPLRDKRCLIVGGRQSAFEWAALIHEAGATAVHVSHRHDSPAFQESEWEWVNPLVDAMVADPGWFRTLPPEEQQSVIRRLWGEGRLKIEPWLKERVNRDGIMTWPNTRIVACQELPTGELVVTLDADTTLTVDEVIFATGYKVDMGRIPLLARGNLLQDLAMRDGFPILDEHFESSVPGLFITSMPAGQDFGPFFGFTVSARTSAKLIGEALRRRISKLS